MKMTAKLLLILLLGATAYAMPKSRIPLEDKLNAAEVSSILMPGPVLLPGNGELLPVKSEQDENCVLCEFVVGKIDTLLKQNSTEEEIKKELDELCSALPDPSISAECKDFVKDYVDPIITALADMSPEMVCKELGLCKTVKGEVVSSIVEVNSIRSSPQCELCEMIVQELNTLLSANSTQQEIEQALEQVCGLLPSQYKAECDSLVEQYIPAIVDILVNEFSPELICTTIQLCASSKLIKRTDASNNTLCDMCKDILGIAKKLIEDNETEADVEKTLKLICWYMLPVKAECDNFIDKFVPLVFNELKKLDPDTICKQIKFCPSGFSPNDVSPNDVRCYLNQQNRCEDPELARKCGAETYCKLMRGN